MKKNILKYFSFFVVFFCNIIFTGCPINVEIAENKDGTFDWNFETTSGKEINNFIFSIEGISDNSKTKSIFDTTEIQNSLLNLGLKNVNVISKKKSEQEETLFIKFKSSDEQFKFLKAIKNSNNKLTKVELTLSKEILQEIITNQNSIIQKYADLLMAPCFTNEIMDNKEYFELLSSFYGNKLAQELTSGNVTITIKNSDSKNAKENIEISLIDILTLQEEKTYSVFF